MDINAVFPAEAMIWLTRYGLFSVACFFAAFLFALLLRPFWLWFSGRAEELEHLKRLEDNGRKALLELEILNQTLSIPIKKATQKPQQVEPMVVSDATKADFLKALERSRTRLKSESPDEPQTPQ